MSALVQYLNFLKQSSGKNEKKEKSAELKGYEPSVAGALPERDSGEEKPIAEQALVSSKASHNINNINTPAAVAHASAEIPAITTAVHNPSRGNNAGVPYPLSPKKFTSIPRVLENLPKMNTMEDPRSGTLLDKRSSVKFARNTGISDVEGEIYVNGNDVELLGKLGFEYSCEEYLGLEKTSEVLDVYSYIEKVAGVPKEVAKLIDAGKAFSGEYLKDMGYSVPKGYEVKSDLVCPIEKKASKERVRVVLPYENQYLLEKLMNPKWPDNYGKRRFPGGGIDGSETPAQAASREFMEELGINASPDKFEYMGLDPASGNHYLKLMEHGLAPGKYKASVGSDPYIYLEQGLPEGLDYLGADISKFAPVEKTEQSFQQTGKEEKESSEKTANTQTEAEAWHQRDKKYVTIHVPTLISRVKGRQAQEMNISSIKGGTKTSPGYSDSRLKGTNVKYPIIVDSKNELVDGRHRKIKLLDAGKTKAQVIRINDDDIDACSLHKTANTQHKLEAVVIKGNPKYLNNPHADKFYQNVADHLKGHGYNVSFDNGEPYTSPKAADLWVGHSRGADRLRFAPKHTKTIALGGVGGITHSKDKALSKDGPIPDKWHFTLSADMKSKINNVIGKTKTAAADPAQTILITGHSGSGKTTLSRQLAEKLKLPVYRVDAQQSWDNLREHFGKNPELERKALIPGSAENKKYVKDIRKIVHKSLKEINGPAILEGTQLTTLPAKQLEKYRASIVVGGDMGQSIAQRLQRAADKAAAKGITFSPEQLAKKREESQLVADSWHPGIEKFKKLPGVINYNHTEHQLKPLVKQLKQLMNKQASEKPGLWANVHAKKARGEKAAEPGDEDYPDSEQWKKLTKAAVSAWQRSEGKNPEGGLNAKGRASYKKETGGTLKAPVTESEPKGERAKRQNSFCSRMCGMKSKNTGSEAQSNPDSRINKALSKWNCKCGEDHGSLYEKAACSVKDDTVEKTASRLRDNVNITTLNDPSGLTEYIASIGDKKIGNMLVADSKYKGKVVAHSLIDPEFRGMGLGKKLYGEVMRRQPEGVLHSGPVMSEDAQRVWASLNKNKGYEITGEVPELMGRINEKALNIPNKVKKLRFVVSAVEAKSSLFDKIKKLMGIAKRAEYKTAGMPTPAPTLTTGGIV